jgi:hypothetical protein
VDERARRIGINEALFRQVNEEIDRLASERDQGGEPLGVLCECGDIDCTGQIAMSPSEYQQLRSDSTLFAVMPGHEAPDVEDILHRREGYNVVRKRSGPAAKIAEATRPQS